MKCDDARAAFLTGTPSRGHLEHLGSCTACRSVEDELESTLAILDDDSVWEEPGPELEDRVVALVSGGRESTPIRVFGRHWLGAAAVIVALVIAAAIVLSGRAPAPDWEAALPGTAAATEASGMVQGWNEEAGTRLRFDVDGLPEAPEGAVYEVWFSRGEVHVSAGTFATGGEIEMWTGIARRDYPRIWITLEPLDSNEGPSGPVVLDTG